MSATLLPAAFVSRMQRDLPREEQKAFFDAYEKPACRGIRVNSLKVSTEEFKKISPFALRPVPWEANGFYVAEERPGRHPYHFAGLYYCQEPSAMSVVPQVGARPGEMVLDLCAAPGGKSTQLAQDMEGKGVLFCNEPVQARAHILTQNIERMGVRNAVAICSRTADLARRFPNFFDRILVDAPCSGEGMFRKNPGEALKNWSEENVRLCAQRQRKILQDAASMLTDGGTLAYSTCTFSREEDEGQTELFLQEHPDFALVSQQKLYPHRAEGEGHYCAILKKETDEACGHARYRWQREQVTPKERAAFLRFCETQLKHVPKGSLFAAGGVLYLLPVGMPYIDWAGTELLRAGVRAGEFAKDRFVPSHALAMCLRTEDAVRSVHCTVSEAEKYMRGETLLADVSDGWCLVCADAYPLGWGKATGGVIKNHYPKGLRLVK